MTPLMYESLSLLPPSYIFPLLSTPPFHSCLHFWLLPQPPCKFEFQMFEDTPPSSLAHSLPRFLPPLLCGPLF